MGHYTSWTDGIIAVTCIVQCASKSSNQRGKDSNISISYIQQYIVTACPMGFMLYFYQGIILKL